MICKGKMFLLFRSPKFSWEILTSLRPCSKFKLTLDLFEKSYFGSTSWQSLESSLASTNRECLRGLGVLRPLLILERLLRLLLLFYSIVLKWPLCWGGCKASKFFTGVVEDSKTRSVWARFYEIELSSFSVQFSI